MHRGLKQVGHRRRDALSRVTRDEFESLVAEHYHRQDYQVEHVGAGAGGSRFDGGVDLRLRRDDAYILVQCKHLNACKVPRNDVHQLLGLMANEGATGAILVTSGEFSKAALEAAARRGDVRLIDGDELRAMLGPLPPGLGAGAPVPHRAGRAGRLAATVGERLPTAAEERPRHGPRARIGRTAGRGVWPSLLRLTIAAVLLLALGAYLKSTLGDLFAGATAPSRPAAQRAATQRPAVPVATTPAPRGTPHDMPVQSAFMHPMSQADIRGGERKNAEAMKIPEATTPTL